MEHNSVKKNIVYIMIGAPGSGKSTIAQRMQKAEPTLAYVSRDLVRFSLMNEGDSYFGNEHQVYRNFIYEILNNINKRKDVIIDATHLTKKSRQKLFNSIHIDKTKTKVVAIYMNTPLNLCLERNETRRGTKTYVPPSALRRMFFNIEPPTYHEYNKIFDTIVYINTNNDIVVAKKGAK